MKIFISQPMGGRSVEVVKRDRAKAIDLIHRAYGDDVEIVNPNLIKGEKPLTVLAKSLELLAQADLAYFAPGWENARGCKIEHKCCLDYGIDSVMGKELCYKLNNL